MFKKKGVCVIEYAQDVIRVTAVSGTVKYHVIPLQPGDEDKAAAELAVFMRRYPARRVMALSPRTFCVIGTFRLPSHDHDELLKMVQFQFSRSSPYKKEDLLVDVKVIDEAPPSKTVVSGAMMVRERLMPFLDILKKAGITPDVITPNIQRLLPLAKFIWGGVLKAEGKLLGLWLNDTVSLALFSGGELYFSREEKDVSLQTVTAFLEYCQQEFPGITIADGLFLGDPDQTGHKRAIAGVLINVGQFSDYLRTAKDQALFEQSPSAFLDFLLAGDVKTKVFDFSPDSVKEGRLRLQQRKFIIHVVLIVTLLFFGFAVKALALIYQKKRAISALNEVINAGSSRVKELEEKARVVSMVENHMGARLSVLSIFTSLSKILPSGVHLTGFEFKDGILNIQGEATDLDSAHSFQAALQGGHMFQNVRLESIDKRPTETAQVVVFRMNMKVTR